LRTPRIHKIIDGKEQKYCINCNSWHPLTLFYKDARAKDNLEGICKNCQSKKLNLFYENNKQRIQKRRRELYKNNKERVLQRRQELRLKNIEKVRVRARRYAKKIRATPMGKLNSNISCAIWYSLQVINSKGNRHWEDLVGWTLQQLKNRFVQLFQPGMTWDNYGEWHIDHKIPISAFNFTKPEHLDFKRCWALKNLQPLWAKENFAKYNRIDRLFQPSLKL
jgi:5-methylcytosine-specific restriction endonuclease McrA